MLEPRLFDLRLPSLALERGGEVVDHYARGWVWGPHAEPRGDRGGALLLEPKVPTVLLVHALTGDAAAGGERGWWAPLIGPGRALDPTRLRLLCFNNLGSCYGSSGPHDVRWPRAAELTPVDQARALLLALDAVGADEIELVAGGSLGGMITLALGALAPSRFKRLLPIAAPIASSAWVIGFNHVQREALRLDPEHPSNPARGLALARQIAMLTYRAVPGLESTQSRALPQAPGARTTYRIQSYLSHQGEKLRARFTAGAYLAMLDALDHHDLVRGAAKAESIRASCLLVDIDTDALFTSAEVDALGAALRGGGARVERVTLRSLHGHDAFLIEWAQLGGIVERALSLPEAA